MTPTSPAIKLLDSQIASYREQGYLLLGKLMDDQTVRELFQYLAAQAARPGDKGTLFYTQKRRECPAIAKFVAHGPQVPAMNQLIGPNLRCWFDQVVVKPAGETAGVFPWHQDNGYNAPIPSNNITVWIALDETTMDNGCIWVIPGSHKQGLIPHKKKSPESWHIEVDAGDTGIPVLLKPGEAVAFTGFTLHRSMGNHTSRPRRAFFVEYCDADAVFNDGYPINGRPEKDDVAGGLFAAGLSPVITGVSKFK